MQTNVSASRSEVLAWLPFFGMFAGAGGILVLVFLLHWVIWGFGDWLLYPLARLLSSNSVPLWEQPAVVWSLAGAIIGALWGTGRALAATGHTWARYAVIGVLAVLFLTVLLNAMLTVG